MHRFPAAAWRRTKISAIRGAAAANSSQVATAVTVATSAGGGTTTSPCVSVGFVLLTAAGAVLLLVDFQQRLVPAVHDGGAGVAPGARPPRGPQGPRRPL